MRNWFVWECVRLGVVLCVSTVSRFIYAELSAWGYSSFLGLL